MDHAPLDHTVPDDGAFFCEIRRHQGLHGYVNYEAEKDWLQRLANASSPRREQLDQLFNHQGYLRALTALLEAGLQGLFAGFRFQAMQEVMDSGTEEVGRSSQASRQDFSDPRPGIRMPP